MNRSDSPTLPPESKVDADPDRDAWPAGSRVASRRSLLGSVGAASVGALAGCLGSDGDDADPDGANDDADESAGGGEERHPAFDADPTADLVYDDAGLQPVSACGWTDPDLVAHDVAGTGMLVVPSFPAGWEADIEALDATGGELRYGDPDLRTEDGRMLTEIYVHQRDDVMEADDVGEYVDLGLAVEVDPVELGGEERMVVQLGRGEGAYVLTAPSPTPGEYYELQVSGGGPDDCGESVVGLAREVVDALVVNPETTL